MKAIPNEKLLVVAATLMVVMLLPTMLQAQQADNYPPTASTTVELTESNLPIIIMDVDGQMILRDERITAWAKIIWNGDGEINYVDTVAHPDQNIDYEGYVGLRYRGNSSFTESDKKPYSFRAFDKPVEDGGKKQKVKILGMGKDNDWALIAPFSDKTMIRDILTFELARPWMAYVPSGKFCELILDGTYYGVYLMCERVTKGKNRLNLNDPGDDDGDLTGDYLVEIDRNDEEYYYVSKFHPFDADGNERTDMTILYQYKAPEYEDFADLPSGTQEALHEQIDLMEASFYTDDYLDAEVGYRTWIVEESFIDYMLATELSMNIDGYRASTNLYKYSETRSANEGLDHRWQMSLWDYNIAYGNANYYYGWRTDLWQYDFNSRTGDDAMQVPFWWYRMRTDSTFLDNVSARWEQWREGSYSDERLYATIDSLTTVLTEGGAVDRNQQAWGNIGVYAWPNYYVGETYEDEVEWMTDWIEARLSFMDRNLLKSSDPSYVPVTVASGWNSDVVVEALPATSYCTDAIDLTRTFYSADLKSDGGLPTDYAVVTTNGVSYTLSDYSSANALFLENYGESGTLTFATPFTADELWFLCTSTNSDATVTIEVNYSDGTSTGTVYRTIPDFSVREPDGSEAVTARGCVYMEDDSFSSDNHYCMFDISVELDPDRTATSVTITSAGTPRATIFALSRLGGEEVGITPVTYSGNGRTAVGIYDINGIKRENLQRGINIIRFDDGSAEKVIR